MRKILILILCLLLMSGCGVSGQPQTESTQDITAGQSPGQEVSLSNDQLKIIIDSQTYYLLEVDTAEDQIVSFHKATVKAQCEGKLTAPQGSDFTGTFEVISDVCPIPHAGEPIGTKMDDGWMLNIPHYAPDEDGKWKPYGIYITVYSTGDPDTDGLFLYIMDVRDNAAAKYYWGVRAESEDEARSRFYKLWEDHFDVPFSAA